MMKDKHRCAQQVPGVSYSAPYLALPGYCPVAAPGPSPDACMWTHRGGGYVQVTAFYRFLQQVLFIVPL